MVAEIARTGTRREILEALRDKLAEAIDADPEPRDLAALVLRLEKIVADLEGLVGVGSESRTDALAERRRRKAANG